MDNPCDAIMASTELWGSMSGGRGTSSTLVDGSSIITSASYGSMAIANDGVGCLSLLSGGVDCLSLLVPSSLMDRGWQCKFC